MVLTKLLKMIVGDKPQAKDKGAGAKNSYTITKVDEKELNRKALRKGELGEYKVDLQLERLPKGYKYISDLLVRNAKAYSGYSQIDHIVISPYGLYIIETKNYAGEISGSKKDKTWKRNKKHDVLIPLHQNYAHISTIKELLSEYKQLKYYSIISFTRRCVFYVDEELTKITSPEQIIYDTELSDVLSRKNLLASREYSKPPLSPIEVDHIYKRISYANITDLDIRKEHENKNRNRNRKETGFQSNNTKARCSICGKPLSDKVRAYCLNNSKKFNGNVYCMDHQVGTK